jgi:mono/diheme cytochrome c family protein
VAEDKVVDFEVLYRQNCAGCHGANGQWGPGPPLNDPLFLAIVPDAELLRVITEGRPGTPMPAFAREKGGPLTAEQVKALAEGIKPRWGSRDKPKDDVPRYLAPEVKPGEVGAGNAEQGAKVFARACAVCHGNNGEGVKRKDQLVHRINDPVFLALLSNQAVRRYAITGRPDFKMPSYAEPRPEVVEFRPLTAQEITHLVALLDLWRQGRSVNGNGKGPGGGGNKTSSP